jgi:hypothetical protein
MLTSFTQDGDRPKVIASESILEANAGLSPSQRANVATPSIADSAPSEAVVWWLEPLAITHRGTTVARQASALDGLEALRQAVRQAERVEKQQVAPNRSIGSANPFLKRADHFAAPLSPLKARDLDALDQLFHRQDIYEIETDVAQMLLRLLPEPCWEEETFDFLEEFL